MKILNHIGFLTIAIALWWACLLPYMITVKEPDLFLVLYIALTGLGSFYTSYKIWTKLLDEEL